MKNMRQRGPFLAFSCGTFAVLMCLAACRIITATPWSVGAGSVVELLLTSSPVVGMGLWAAVPTIDDPDMTLTWVLILTLCTGPLAFAVNCAAVFLPGAIQMLLMVVFGGITLALLRKKPQSPAFPTARLIK